MAGPENDKNSFDPQEFARNLAMQAESLIPVDISEENKKYIVNIVYNFCTLACEPLLKDDKFSLQDSVIITQFVGEWTFHKSIDLTRAGIVDQPRDSVLKDIAFIVFEIAKQAISKKMPQEQVIQVIEHHVKKTYLNSLTTLKERNIITPQDFDAAMGQSNIDQMAEQNDIPQEQAPQQVEQEEFSTSKILKLASFAMVLQKMPQEKINSILSKLPPREANLVRDYIAMDDLSEKADSTVLKYITEIQRNMPKTEIRGDKLQHKLAKIVTKKNELKIDGIISKERERVREYIASIKEKRNVQLSTPISNIIYEHLLEKVKK